MSTLSWVHFFFVPCWTLKWLSYKTLMSIFCWDCQGTHCIIMQPVLFIQSVKSRQGTLDSAIGALSHPSLSWTVLTITMIDGWVISTAHLFSSLLAQTRPNHLLRSCTHSCCSILTDLAHIFFRNFPFSVFFMHLRSDSVSKFFMDTWLSKSAIYISLLWCLFLLAKIYHIKKCWMHF